jgi:putative endonuclease
MLFFRLTRKKRNNSKKGNRALGKKGEDIAARFLSIKGYRVIGRNVRTYVGEIDIVAEKKGAIIIVEVKTKQSSRFGPPYQSVTERKKKKLIHCGLCYLKMKGLSDAPWQIDVVSLEIRPVFWCIKRVFIEHFSDAVSNEGGNV